MRRRIGAVAVLLGVLALMLVPVFVGCASADPYKDACRRFGEAGQGIIEDMPAETPGQKLRLEAFKDAVNECLRLGNQ